MNAGKNATLRPQSQIGDRLRHPFTPMVSRTTGALVPQERILRAILEIRGHRVLLDADMAALYGVETRVLVQR
jgi:hypothetical protein